MFEDKNGGHMFMNACLQAQSNKADSYVPNWDLNVKGECYQDATRLKRYVTPTANGAKSIKNVSIKIFKCDHVTRYQIEHIEHKPRYIAGPLKINIFWRSNTKSAPRIIYNELNVWKCWN